MRYPSLIFHPFIRHIPLAQPYKDTARETVSSFSRRFTFTRTEISSPFFFWDERTCLKFNLAFRHFAVLSNLIPKSLSKLQGLKWTKQILHFTLPRCNVNYSKNRLLYILELRTTETFWMHRRCGLHVMLQCGIIARLTSAEKSSIFLFAHSHLLGS